jgi:hypothetical protein
MLRCGPSLVAILVRGRWRVIAIRRCAAVLSPLLVWGLLAGCTNVVNGSMRPAAGLAPHPILGSSVSQVLLDGAELSRTFGQGFVVDPNQPSATGGRELLRGNAMTPPQCGGVATMLISDGYAGSYVRDVAVGNWLYSGPNPAVIMVHEAVVGMPTNSAANDTFTAMAQQWGRCDDASTTIGGDANFTFHVGHIEHKDSVLSAPVDQISSYMTLAQGRAIGVRVNCIVEVEIVYYGRDDRDSPSHQTPTAANVAHLLMDKISALT